MNKLISMTDFVLEQVKNATTETEKYAIIEWQNKCDAFDKITDYANFLKKPLTLSMFVPTDENGCVLEEPKNYKDWKRKALNVGYDLDLSKYEIYQQAKSKCIFDGFTYDQKQLFLNGELFWLFEKNDFTFDNKTIEELIPYNLTLTDNVKI